MCLLVCTEFGYLVGEEVGPIFSLAVVTSDAIRERQVLSILISTLFPQHYPL